MEKEFTFKIENHNFKNTPKIERTFENSFGHWVVIISRNGFYGYVVFIPKLKFSESLLEQVKITLNFINYIYAHYSIMDVPAFMQSNSLFNFGVDDLNNEYPYRIEIKVDATSLFLQSPHKEQNSIQSSMVNDHLKQMYETSQLTDIIIKTKDEKEIKAHNLILSRSKVFNAMLNNHDTKEAQNKVIEIEDIDHDVLVEMIRYLYTDVAQNIKEKALKLLIAANKYDIPGLEAECVDYLITNVKEDSFADILIIADQLNIHSLKAAVFNFVIKNRKIVLQSDVWKNLKITHMDLAMEVAEKYLSNN